MKQQQFPIPNSGTISKDSNKKLDDDSLIHKELDSYTTKDGTFSLYSKDYSESFHNIKGARKEAEEKFICPAQSDNFHDTKKIRLLDVCFGLGYNTGCFIEKLLGTKTSFKICGLEIDKRPLQIGLDKPIFRNNWSPYVLRVLEELRDTDKWSDEKNNIQILWGDAREKLKEIPSKLKFDLIFLDAFSPPKCPQLWSEEFLFQLASKLSPKGRLITYCRAASIRGSLNRAGLHLKSMLPDIESSYQWSEGTIASPKNLTSPQNTHKAKWKDLSQREIEHLSTRAAVPYRDPTGSTSSGEILLRRQQEQKGSRLRSTSEWRKYWEKLN